MDPTTVTIVLFVTQAIMGIAAYFMKSTQDKTQKDLERQVQITDALRTELNDVKVNYVSKIEFGTFENRLWERFDRLESKIDNRK